MPRGSSPAMALFVGYRLAGTMAAIAILGVAASGVVYALHRSETDRMLARIDSKLDAARNGERTAKQLETVRSEESRLDAQLRDLEASVTPSLYVPSLLRQVDQLARSMQLDVVSIRHVFEQTPVAAPEGSSEEVKKAFRPLPYDKDNIDLEVRGRYWTIAKFVHNMTRFPKILAVESVSQQPVSGETSQPGLLVARIRLTGFVFKDGNLPPSDATSGASPIAPRSGAMAPSIPVEN